MQIFVKNLSGRTATHYLSPGATAQDLREQIHDCDGIPCHQQRLTSGGRVLDGRLGCELEGSTVFVNLELLGGGKKRKKKQYTTPKKNKHRHVNIKLAVLNYYKVLSDGTVKSLKKECPNKDTCPFSRMATHFNRYTCGRCGYTIRTED